MMSISATTTATALQLLQKARIQQQSNSSPSTRAPASAPKLAAGVAGNLLVDRSSAASSVSPSEDDGKGRWITAYGSFAGHDEAAAFVKNSSMSDYEKQQEVADLEKMKAFHDSMEAPETKALLESIDKAFASEEYKEHQKNMEKLTRSKEYLEAMAPIRAMQANADSA